MSVIAEQSLSVISTNASNNTAVIRYIVTCSCTGESYNNYTQSGTFVIDGVGYNNSYTLPRNSTTTVFNRDITVYNASGRTISASYSFPTTPAGGTKTGNTSVGIPVLVQAPVIHSLTVKSRTMNSITFSFSVNHADTFYYKLSTESGYKRGSNNVTNGEFTISNLEPNRSYTINFIARNWISEASQTYIDNARNISATTYDIAKISELNDFEHGGNITAKVTNPSGITGLTLTMKIGNERILTRTLVAGTNTITLTDEEWKRIYKLYGNSKELTVTFVLSGNGYTYEKSSTVRFTGEEKTLWININGNWKRSQAHINKDNLWRKAVIWINKNGIWKRGI